MGFKPVFTTVFDPSEQLALHVDLAQGVTLQSMRTRFLKKTHPVSFHLSLSESGARGHVRHSAHEAALQPGEHVFLYFSNWFEVRYYNKMTTK